MSRREPSAVQVAAALETLLSAGYVITAPAHERLRLLSVAEVTEAIGCSATKAREIVASLPNSVRLPGNDLRARPADLEQWIEQHRMTP